MTAENVENTARPRTPTAWWSTWWAQPLTTRLSHLALIAVSGLFLAYWLKVFQYHLVQGDDFLNAAMAGRPGGRMNLIEWWGTYMHDYTEVNGRMADALVRLLLIPGAWLWRILGPVTFLATTWLIYRAGTASLRARGAELPFWAGPVLWVAAACSVPFMIWRIPIIAGDAIFWMSSTVTYVISTVFVMIAVLGLARLSDGVRPARPTIAAFGVAILLAHLLHEESSLAMAAAVVATWLVAAHLRQDRILWVWSGVSLAGFLLQTCAPGVWARFALTNGGDGPKGVNSGMLAKLANAEQVLATATGPLLIAATLFATLFVCCRPVGWVLRGVAVASVLSAVVVDQLAVYRLAKGLRIFEAGIADVTDRLPVVLPGLLGVAVVFGGLLVLGFALRESFGSLFFVMLAAAGGSLVAPFAIGVVTPRSYVPPFLFLAAVVVILAAQVLADQVENPVGWTKVRLVAAAVVVLACGATYYNSAPVAQRLPKEMAANERVWRTVEAQIDRARSGQCTKVEMPKSFPRLYLFYSGAYLETRYAGYMKLYYELPEKASFTWKQGEGDCAPKSVR
ncbi:hypothetical protein SAMN05421595_2731 [Austwickia chelonae]|uniref:Glycosyltransferase RgtA/B/C/D-like domain-containing protein n=1 Tax=Austwickia chelonae NBRC 105200 TaxID=1184607 RepID=K6W9D7_9MICO|nr:DUF6056 family protein [Austwickia chelonae]GAB78462.1 hypothetical protein AUCHE_09_00670 [Austwickia chelonae NBRC 105200]SEW39808.1 hypothetical protein SAMN05421595_2731 [Austwickia chelonae]